MNKLINLFCLILAFAALNSAEIVGEREREQVRPEAFEQTEVAVPDQVASEVVVESRRVIHHNERVLPVVPLRRNKRMKRNVKKIVNNDSNGNIKSSRSTTFTRNSRERRFFERPIRGPIIRPLFIARAVVVPEIIVPGIVAPGIAVSNVIVPNVITPGRVVPVMVAPGITGPGILPRRQFF